MISFCDARTELPHKSECFAWTGRGKPIAPALAMAGWKHFREIAAWQHARTLKLKADSFLNQPQFRREYKFCDQLKDAARSGPRNIAEGFGRFSNKQFAHFVTIAKGSEAEVLNHFIDAHDQGLITDQELREGEHAALKAMKAAVGLIKHLEDSA